jgi:hypothetical protein
LAQDVAADLIGIRKHQVVLVLAAAAASVLLGGAAPRPDPRLCQTIPSEWDVSPKAVTKAISKARASAPGHQDADEAAAVARDRAMSMCLHRFGYLMARTATPVQQVAAAAFNRCDTLQGYSADVSASAVLANKSPSGTLKLEKEAMLDKAARRVIEARAGSCWLR